MRRRRFLCEKSESGRRIFRIPARPEKADLDSQGLQGLSATSYWHAYWTVAQLLAHHTVNGCNLQPGDLFGSGTLSGPTLDQAGALIELTAGGKNPLSLPDGERRAFLEDGDTVILRGWCERPGSARIGFGECRGSVLPAVGVR